MRQLPIHQAGDVIAGRVEQKVVKTEVAHVRQRCLPPNRGMSTGDASVRRRARTSSTSTPEAYKDIDAVMAHQADLVAFHHALSQIFNYKG